MNSEEKNPNYYYNLEVPYPDENTAKIVMSSISADPELQPDKLTRNIYVQGNFLIATFETQSLRSLRSSVNGFYDMLILATKTLDEFSFKN